MATTINIPQSFTLFKIRPRASEVNDPNMPTTIFSAISLFYMTEKSNEAEKCSQCLTSTLNILAAGPDGKTEIQIGTPCICWECGYLGIPEKEVEEGIFECRFCKSSTHTNIVEGMQPDGSQIPWIEKKG